MRRAQWSKCNARRGEATEKPVMGLQDGRAVVCRRRQSGRWLVFVE